MIYVLSISFQVAGALLLMINSLSTKRDKVIRRFAGRGMIFKNNDTDSIEYKKEALIETYREAYLSKCAFLLIAMGYFGGVFGKIGDNSKVFLAMAIIAVTIIVIALSYFIVNLILKYNKTANLEITSKELADLGIEPDMENISKDEIDKMFE